MANENYAVEVDHVTIRFNMASEKVDNLKEYVIKLIKKQLTFQEFFALQDVSFKVKKGEAWGLIGVNGSGKSTMLKAISGILKPYKGSIKVHGEIAPLIELGAGFDPDLTARENIYLDTPIKNFSSGMKARLGFSVATMVDPDILICDEVLSVGDFLFQQKCMDRMSNMLSGGTTLLFVSHNVEQVKKLCDHAIWLEKGKVRACGEVNEVCDQYMELAKMNKSKR